MVINEDKNANNPQSDNKNTNNQQVVLYSKDIHTMEEKKSLKYLNYIINFNIQQKSNSPDNQYILILAEIQGIITNSLYRKEMREKDFLALNDILFGSGSQYPEIQDKFEFLIGSFEDKIISIENLSEKELILKIRYKAVGKSSYDMRIVLPKTNRETVITLEMLCREIQRLNTIVKENKCELKKKMKKFNNFILL
ncbi:hypothetical protein PIROE2DRAFT_17677 [Piromyces sp. E2]|nr:hypothetical protein PIROE2DRAFT_17677 [Piromyces sp. E2]|eukprot:OUM57372.1 hypothetical protein PIROE2DRAFT_17677 [Piromyces sp. E2]